MARIVVTGIPRSGTSRTMAILEAGGVPCVYEQVVNDGNPGGYYESSAAIAGDFSGVPDGYAVKCLHMLPTVDPGLDVRVIICRRDIGAALVSANRRAAAQGRPVAAASYATDLQGDIDAIRAWCAGKPHLELWFDDMFWNTANECLRIQRFLGLDTDRLAAMADVVIGRSY